MLSRQPAGFKPHKAKGAQPRSRPASALHQAPGREGMQRLLDAGVIHAKLRVGQPNDSCEQEADRAADRVMRMSQPPFKGACTCGGRCPKCQAQQGSQERVRLHTKPVQSGDPGQTEAPSIVHEVLRSPGQPLDPATRAAMGSRFGHDFGAVRVHTDPRAAASAKALNALAYTVGQRIVFGAGQYLPGADAGRQLLAHELAHTLQQRDIVGPGSVQRSPSDMAVPDIDDPAAVEEWVPPEGADLQWKNEALRKLSLPERANGLRAFLLFIKELELRGYLDKSAAVEKNKVRSALSARLEELNSLGLDALEKEVDEVLKRYENTLPSWATGITGAIKSFSGMKYQSAHGSYFSPQKLLSILKAHELDSADRERKEMMIAEGSEVLQDESILDILPNKQKKPLKSDLGARSLKSLSKVIPKNEQDALADLVAKEDLLWKSYLELHNTALGSAAFTEALQDIQQKESEIEGMQSSFRKSSWSTIQRERARRKNLFLKISREIALQKIAKLSNPQAAGLLDDMHENGVIPEEVWKEIRAHTDLRLGVSSPDDLVMDRRALKGVQRDPLITPEDWNLWKSFLGKWYAKDSTGWREEHRETLSPNVLHTLVCDQLGSAIKNMRRVSAPGGLRNNAMAYYEAALKIGQPQSAAPAKVDTAFPVGPAEPFFKKPAGIADFPVGASIFWATWSDLSVTEEYMKVYKEETKLKDEVKYLQGQVDALTKKKNQTASDKARIKRHGEDIARRNKRLQELGDSQKSMHIYTPEKDTTPDISNIVSPMQGDARRLTLTKAGTEIKDCASDGEWTYSIAQRQVGKSKVESVMRAKPNPFLRTAPLKCPDELTVGQDQAIVKQWLVWKHEATVLAVIPDQDKVVTFDTSFGWGGKEVKALGTRVRTLDKLLNPEKDQVFVGYMQGK
jgi:uncharacterized protein DUF4157